MTASRETTVATPTKTVYLIRHAESEENRRLKSLKSLLQDLGRFSLPSSQHVSDSAGLINVPAQVDSDVSDHGNKQIQFVANQLERDNFLTTKRVELVIYSPLKRAKETAKGMLGCMESNDDKEQPRVQELDLLIEKTPSEWLPGVGTAWLYSRIANFETWLGEQPENVVCIVGHSQYFRAMLGTKSKFDNCEVWEIQFDPSKETQDFYVEKNGESIELNKGWSGLKRLYSSEL